MKRSTVASDALITAIDIGTTKICVLVAQRLAPDHIEIIGIGKAPSQGLARGVVVDIAPTIHSIKTAVKEAEIMSGVAIKSAYVGISGSHIQARNSQGVVDVKRGQIRQADIQQVLTAARSVTLSEGQQLLHVVPQFFTIDGTQHVRDPLGMYGSRLEAQVHIVTGGLSSLQNLVRCCQMAGVKVRDIVLEPLASAEAVLSEDEKEFGAFMLDIGGGTSDFAFYQQGTIRYTKVIPIAGNIFTRDIALCLRATVRDAERIKQEFGSACVADTNDEAIDVEMIQGNARNTIKRKEIARVLEPRAEELFTIVGHEIHNRHLEAPAGIVLTGGGSLLSGLSQVATRTLGIPARVGKPRAYFGYHESLNSPMYATSYGLLRHVLSRKNDQMFNRAQSPFVEQIFNRMKSWISDMF